jgi:hypothetical protein
VIDVDPERVRLVARSRELDQHAHAIVERLLGHQRSGGRLNLPERRGPRDLGVPLRRQPVSRRGCTAAMPAGTHGSEGAQGCERACRAEPLEGIDEAGEEHRLNILAGHWADVPRADDRRGPLLSLERVGRLVRLAHDHRGHVRE